MEVRLPRGSLAFDFASPLVRAFGAPDSEKTSGNRVGKSLIFQGVAGKALVHTAQKEVAHGSFLLELGFGLVLGLGLGFGLVYA